MFFDTVVPLIKRCKCLQAGKQIHKLITDSGGHSSDVYVSNLLVQMYGKCGGPEEARKVFDATSRRNAISWSLLMAVYAQNGHLREAEMIFNKTPQKDVVSWNYMVAIYTQSGHTDRAAATFQAAPERNVVTWNALLAAYARDSSSDSSSVLEKMPLHDVVSWNTVLASREALEMMPERNAVSWSSLVQILARRGEVEEATQAFGRMPQWNLFPCNAMLAALGRAGRAVEAGRLFDAMADHDVASWTALLDCYAQCGLLEAARRVFSEMPTRNVVSWTAALLLRGGDVKESRATFRRMPQHNLVSWNAMISTYSRSGGGSGGEAGEAGEEAWCTFAASPERDVTSWNALLAAFAGDVLRAEQLLDRMPQQNLVSWNSMLAVYARHGRFRDADGFLKQGHVMVVADVVSWSAVTAALVNSADSSSSLLLLLGEHFGEMNLEGVIPDEACFTNLLVGFKDAGAVEKCRECFVSMNCDYGVQPTADHFGCIVDALGRSGQLHAAHELLNAMPVVPGDVCRTALLASQCRAAAGSTVVELELAMDDQSCAAAYVSLSNMYAAAAAAAVTAPQA